MKQRIRKISCLLESADLSWDKCNELNSLLIDMSVEDIPQIYQQHALEHVSRVLLYDSVLDDHRVRLEKLYKDLSIR